MRSVITGLALSFWFLAWPAGAEPEFPGAIKEYASIPCTPTCLLCHTEIPGNAKNVNPLFGATVLTHGLRPGDPTSLQTVVERLRTDKVDTDKDGKLDVDELAAGSDPNKVETWAEVCSPLYGCGAHVASPPSGARAPVTWWLVTLLALSAWVALRRGRSAG